MSTGTIKVALVDAGTYTYSSTHQFLSSLTGVVGTAQTIGSKTFTNGIFDGADVTFTAVSGASAEALVIYLDTGTASTATVGNTAGALYSAGLFTGGDKGVGNGDTLSVSYTASL